MGEPCSLCHVKGKTCCSARVLKAVGVFGALSARTWEHFVMSAEASASRTVSDLPVRAGVSEKCDV